MRINKQKTVAFFITFHWLVYFFNFAFCTCWFTMSCVACTSLLHLPLHSALFFYFALISILVIWIARWSTRLWSLSTCYTLHHLFFVHNMQIEFFFCLNKNAHFVWMQSIKKQFHKVYLHVVLVTPIKTIQHWQARAYFFVRDFWTYLNSARAQYVHCKQHFNYFLFNKQFHFIPLSASQH